MFNNRFFNTSCCQKIKESSSENECYISPLRSGQRELCNFAIVPTTLMGRFYSYYINCSTFKNKTIQTRNKYQHSLFKINFFRDFWLFTKSVNKS